MTSVPFCRYLNIAYISIVTSVVLQSGLEGFECRDSWHNPQERGSPPVKASFPFFLFTAEFRAVGTEPSRWLMASLVVVAKWDRRIVHAPILRCDLDTGLGSLL